MRVPEISLGYGLLAQNKHDLCRYYKYTERHKQTQYLPAYTVSFMVVPSVRAWEFRIYSVYVNYPSALFLVFSDAFPAYRLLLSKERKWLLRQVRQATYRLVQPDCHLL